MKKIKKLSLILGLVLLLVIPFIVQATVKEANENVYLAQAVVHDGNYYATGNIIEIAGTINGDVFAAGNSVSISGTINGDVFAAGSSVSISGKVDGSVFSVASNILINGEILGNVRVAGSNIIIENKVGRNVMAAGSNVSLTSQAEVAGHLSLAGAVLDVRSKTGGNFEAVGESITLAGDIGGKTKLNLDKTGQVVFLSSAHLMGNFEYTASKEITVSSEVTIDGETIFNQFYPREQKKRVLGIITAGYFFFKLIQLFGLLIVGLVIISLAKKKVLETADLMLKEPAKQIGQGLVWFIVTPVVIILLLITVIGIPLAFLLSLTYIILIYLSKVFAGLAIGLMLTKAFGWQKMSLIGSLILGIIIFVILKSIPIIGWLFSLVAIWWGLGALIEIKKRTLREMK